MLTLKHKNTNFICNPIILDIKNNNKSIGYICESKKNENFQNIISSETETIKINNMEDYIKNFNLFDKKIVYDFRLGDGGIGDNIKFFMFVLESCIKNNKRLYYKKNNTQNEKYLKLKYDIMYVDDDFIKKLDSVEVVKPQMFYLISNYNFSFPINQVFYLTDEVKINSQKLFPKNITYYISIHLRLGDKYLETKEEYKEFTDERSFSEEKLYNFIEKHQNKNIFFCCDNNNYKLKLKKKYNNIIITNCDIGHTSLSNTTEKQILDGITEFYILTNSKMIFAASSSGFSIIASKFNNIPLVDLNIN